MTWEKAAGFYVLRQESRAGSAASKAVRRCICWQKNTRAVPGIWVSQAGRQVIAMVCVWPDLGEGSGSMDNKRAARVPGKKRSLK